MDRVENCKTSTFDLHPLTEPPTSCVVYTPNALARGMVEALLELGGSAKSWLEPSAGDGAFVEAILFGSSRVANHSRVTAVDISSPPDAAFQDDRVAWHPSRDFFDWSTGGVGRFDRIVGNPPYVKLSALPEALRQRAIAAEGPHEVPVPATANYWFAFVRRSLSLLNHDGALAFVLPASFEYATYAKPLLSHLQTVFRRLLVVRSSRPLFANVADGSVVLICLDFRSAGCRCRVRRVEVPDLDGMCRFLSEVRSSLFGQSETPDRKDDRVVVGAHRLSDFLDVRIGCVTGGASFFLLSEAQRIEWRLPPEAFVRVVSRARHLVSDVVDHASWRKLRESGERVWLFSPPESLVRSSKEVQAYLSYGESTLLREAGRRAKVRTRQNWFQPVRPPVPHVFVSGMTREGLRPVLNRAQIQCTNTLYGLRFHRSVPRRKRGSVLAALWHPDVQRQISVSAREYPDGLRKMEPGDIGALRLPPGFPADVDSESFELILMAARTNNWGTVERMLGIR